MPPKVKGGAGKLRPPTSGTRRGNGPGWGGPAKGAGNSAPSLRLPAPGQSGNPSGTITDKGMRRRAQADELMDHLHMIATGQIDAQPVQVHAATAFMAKVLPDKEESTQTIVIKTGVPRRGRD